ncbi:hypothetical protein BCR33DRAFT_713613 [Rhizoclosmatium globosum]|uniref:Nudix hydrolase domain-containing protein n=1 Tax=Rhizoclosmatium globosum TaxID=329046 RepID=A0A1Y2CSR9_9FUNG|nr:hypothetical protein BCR33DRAFT_713613 [Rhizoclosmatium globosum]|eukprot:ORY50023.1 hypothetical protein BCR33DRAFT_713613 [Rhizoclosmatium globosum]
MEALVDAANNLSHEAILQFLSHPSKDTALPLYLDASHSCLIGFIRAEVLTLLSKTPGSDAVFTITDTAVSINSTLVSEQERTHALESLLIRWRDDPNVTLLKSTKWRSERYSVWDKEGNVALQVYGCHVNGYTETDDVIKYWVARRSYTKPTYPGMLDNMVGGGLPHSLSPTANVIKECFEEAGVVITSDKVKPVSVLTSFMAGERGWVPDTEFIYDLKLDPAFKPVCQDGEVHGFELMSIEQLKECLLRNEFMPESGLCVIDFLMRHGFIDPSKEPGYMNIASGLRRSLPFPGPRYQ